MCHGHPHRGRESRGPQPREPGGLGRWVGLRALNQAASRQQDPATPPPIDGARDASGPSLVAVDPTSVLLPSRPIPGVEKEERDMGALRDRMEADLRLRGLSENTRRLYLRCARDFAAY